METGRGKRYEAEQDFWRVEHIELDRGQKQREDD